MKRAVILAVFIALLSTLALPGSLPAEASATPTWTSIVAYFNPNPAPVGGPDELGIVVYSEDDDKALSLPQDVQMAPYQSGTLLIGKIIGEQGFKGSAVISSSTQVVAVYKQAPADNAPYSPIVYTSFDMSQAGQGRIYIPGVQRTTAYDTEIGVQNIETASVVMTPHFYGEDGSERVYDPVVVAGSHSYVFKASDYVEEEFYGSVVIESRLEITQMESRLVAAAQEVQGGGRRAYAYEGVSTGATELMMPEAGCQSGDIQKTSIYAVQNLGINPTNVSVDYYFYDANQNLQVVTSAAKQIQPNFSARFSPCDEDVADQLADIDYMTAVVRSDSEIIAAVCRMTAGNGLATAFLGQALPHSAGDFVTLLPYVEWSSSEDGIHTEIRVLNPNDDMADRVTIEYYNRKGSLVAEHAIGSTAGEGPIPPHGVRMSSPNTQRIIGKRGFTGAVIIRSSVPIVALARVTRSVDVDNFTVLGDDYSGIPYNFK